VPVERGQRYDVSTEGDVGTGAANPWDHIVDFKAADPMRYVSACPNCSNMTDRPMLYASLVESELRPDEDDAPSIWWLAAVVAALIAAVVGSALLIRRRRQTTRR
jgi:hypothetical protein